MSRFARVVAVGEPHHITQRGNNRQPVFDLDADRSLYLQLLQEQANHHRLELWGYCLMPNHVHLIAVPLGQDSLAKTLRAAHATYARFLNTRRNTCGHFWQNRYYSCQLDPVHRWLALAYVERNPVRAGLAAQAAEYQWSSARAHLAGSAVTALISTEEWKQEYTPERWAAVLRTSRGEEALRERLREATRTGRPLGDREFNRDLERRFGFKLEPGTPGRPRRERKTIGPALPQLELAFEIGD